MFYIDDKGNLCPLSMMEFKSAKCLCQSLPNNNGARIVWALKGDVLVAVRFFPKHGNEKESNQYKEFFRNLTDETFPDVKNCIAVGDLINDAEKAELCGGTEVTEVQKNQKTETKDVLEIAQSSTISQEKEVVSEISQTNNESVINTVPVKEPIKNIKSTEIIADDSGTAAANDSGADRDAAVPRWVDIASVAYEITQEYKLTCNKIKRLERGIGKEKDTAKKLKLAKLLVELLGNQMLLEEKMQELHSLNETLEQFRADLRKIKSKE